MNIVDSDIIKLSASVVRHQPYASRVQWAPVFLPSDSGGKGKVPGTELTHCL